MKATESIKYFIIFAVVTILVALLAAFQLGLYTIPIINIVSKRMSPLQLSDYVFLVVFSVLMGITTALYYYVSDNKNVMDASGKTCAIGTFLGFITFICPQCPILIFSLIGICFSLNFLAPYFEILRILSIIFLLVADYLMLKR